LRIVLSASSGVPIYEQIKVQVRDAVYGGDLAVGSSLPSLRQLARDLRVSIITVTRAYNDLVADGLVVNEHGRGFTVLPLDQAEVRQQTTQRLDRAVTDLVAAARAARAELSEVQALLEQGWHQPDDQTDKE
jgi:GntR family transcriptional regulator